MQLISSHAGRALPTWRLPSRRRAACQRQGWRPWGSRDLPRRIPAAASTREEEEEVTPVPPVLLPPLASTDELAAEQSWVSDIVRVWLDEEWTPLEVHQDLGRAAGQAYVKLRQAGQDDVSDLVLGLSSELLAFPNYGDTFVNAFEVSNKVVELLMLRQGCDVCCVGDAGALQRYEEALRAEGSLN